MNKTTSFKKVCLLQTITDKKGGLRTFPTAFILGRRKLIKKCEYNVDKDIFLDSGWALM